MTAPAIAAAVSAVQMLPSTEACNLSYPVALICQVSQLLMLNTAQHCSAVPENAITQLHPILHSQSSLPINGGAVWSKSTHAPTCATIGRAVLGTNKLQQWHSRVHKMRRRVVTKLLLRSRSCWNCSHRCRWCCCCCCCGCTRCFCRLLLLLILFLLYGRLC